MPGLLDPDYGAERRGLIDARRACPEMPSPGDPWKYQAGPRPERKYRHPEPVGGRMEADTSYICTVDRWGNAFSATPSDGVTSTPVVPGLGCIISSRGMQSWLDPDHPSCLAPGKRPRLTPSPGMVCKDGHLFMPYGTPGNDMQPQAMVQYLVNLIDYGMNPQQAMDAPRCATFSFPRSSDPHPYTPGLAQIESRVDPEIAETLGRMGHNLQLWPDWATAAGSLGAIQVNHDNGVLHGAADRRRMAYAMGR